MQEAGLAIVIAVVGIVPLARNWRWLALLLGAQYVGLALLFAGGLAFEAVLVELWLCVMSTALVWQSMPFPKPLNASKLTGEVRITLAAAARFGSAPRQPTVREALEAQSERSVDDILLNPFFQILSLGFCGVVALSLSNTYPIVANATAGYLNFAFFWLATAGVMVLSLTRTPLVVGYGLLFILESVQIAYLARTETAETGMLFALAALQLALILAVARIANPGTLFQLRRIEEDEAESGEGKGGAAEPQGGVEDARSAGSVAEPEYFLVEYTGPLHDNGSSGRLSGFGEMSIGFLLLLCVGLLIFLVLASDPFLSGLALTGLALLVILVMQRGDREQSPTLTPISYAEWRSRGLDRMKFAALATMGGACLQVAAILAGEFEITREPILGRAIVGLLALGLASFVGVFPFHWWLLKLPRRMRPATGALLIGTIGVGALAFLLQMLGSHPWLLADPRSQTTLMALGVLTFGIAALIELSQKDFDQLLMCTVAGNGGIILAGIAANSHPGLAGAGILLINQVISVLLLLACLGVGRPAKQFSFESLTWLTRQSPLAALGVVVGSLTLLGVPPFAGFVGRWFVYVEIARHNTYLAVLVIAASVISLFGFVPAFRRLLEGLRRESVAAPRAAETATRRFIKAGLALSRAGIIILALLPLAAGLYPVPILQAIGDILREFHIQF